MSNLIKLGHIGLTFHEAAALQVKNILVKHGHDVELISAPHEEMFQLLAAGDIDLLCAAWLPDSHGGYLESLQTETTKLTVLYEPFCIWGVPDYVPVEDVEEVSDLLKPDIAAKMERLIQGINPGAGISRFSKTMINEYGLAELGYHFNPGSEQDCFGRFIDAHAEKRWIVVPLWHPQWLHNRYTIRALREPKGLLGGKDEATLIGRNSSLPSIAPDALQEIRQLYLGNPKVSELDDEIASKANPEPQTTKNPTLRVRF